MKKKIIFIAVAIAIISIISWLVIIQINNTKIKNLELEAIGYYESGDYDNAVTVYTQVLDITNSPDVKDKILEIQKEQYTILCINNLFIGFGNIRNAVDNTQNPKELIELLQSIEPQTNKYNSLEDIENSEINQFIESFNNNPVFILYQQDYLTGNVIQVDANMAIIFNSEKFLVRTMMDTLLKTELPKQCDIS